MRASNCWRQSRAKRREAVVFAVQYTEYGGPEVLSVGEAPSRTRGPGQIRVVVTGGGRQWDGLEDSGRDDGCTGQAAWRCNRLLGLRCGWCRRRGRRGRHRRRRSATTCLAWAADTQAEYAVLDLVGVANLRRWTGPVAAGAGVVAEAAERVLRLLGVTEGTHALHRRWRRRGRLGGDHSSRRRVAPWCIASASEANQDYLPRDRRHPGGVRRRRWWIASAHLPDRQGRRRARRGWQNTDRGFDQPGARSRLRSSRSPTSGSCVGRAGDRRRRRQPAR